MAFKGDIPAPAGVPVLIAGPVSGAVFFQNLGANAFRVMATETATPPADFAGGWRYRTDAPESLDVAALMPGVPGARYLWVLSEGQTTLTVQYGDIEDA
ncbi:hypothetical protein [Pelagimonas varians]|uniref:Uncharacterized protein n=1 Tax=Pelagimonas varians TaxID=696760 RepID=A0A238KDK2_9RHOB|nr:hypothetical protein [Pelagimonas varians]PYG29958.1 hypothetical protein C8N36_107124 [Pelagimonas varians]SMX40647.1 hypothetical protein PEV8663_02071 [Pelagimonas varians]